MSAKCGYETTLIKVITHVNMPVVSLPSKEISIACYACTEMYMYGYYLNHAQVCTCDTIPEQ